jgi:heat shock protein HslJ
MKSSSERIPVMKKIFVVIGCILLLTLLAPFETVPEAGTMGGSSADLGGITVRSNSFPSGTVTLKNGEYRESAAPGSAVAMVVKLTDRHAFGTVNGQDAAAVVIVTDHGGSGTFFDLALLFKVDGGWINIDTTFLGDRVKVRSVDIRDNEIFVSMTTHAPGDALCCPTQQITRRFEIQTDRLIAQEEEKKTAIGEYTLVGPVWRWVRTHYANDATLNRAPGAAGYTLQLKRDRTIQIQDDCNAGGGSYTLQGANLVITITHTTMAACPDSPQEAAFFRDLGRTAGFHFKNGGLVLDLNLDFGSMEFHE